MSAPQTVTITVNGQKLEAKSNETVLQVLNRSKVKVPQFCYHPKLSVAGVCRMCLIEVEGSRKLEIACSLPVRDGMVVHTESPKVVDGRAFVMEFTLVNHPLDCPICDQAGECWLQEFYMAHDKKPSAMIEEKVHKDKAKPIGPRVMLDQERCILCTRCVRFTDEITKTSEIGIWNRGDRSVLDVAPGKVLDNDYSENVVDICPVGALTSREFRFDTRVWFLKETDSICPGCARGCNVVLQEKDERVRRILPRVNDAVNGHWMCDAGRDVHLWVHADTRLDQPRARDAAGPLAWPEAMAKAKAAVEAAKKFLPAEIVGMASVRACNEDNLVFCRFMETVFGDVAITNTDITPRTWKADEILKVADRNPNTKGAKAVVKNALSIDKFVKQLEDGKIKALFVVDQDLLFTDDKKLRERLEKALKTLPLLVVFSTHADATTALAHLALPLTTFAEQSGTFTNVDGRVQEFKASVVPVGLSLPLWKILVGLAQQVGKPLRFHSPEDLKRETQTVAP